MAPLTVWMLGLPVVTGILLIFGLVRKELVLLGAVAIFGTTNLSLFMTPVQLVTLALVSLIYFPCVSVFAILAKDFGKKAAITISIANIVSAIIIGGIAFRLLSLIL
jgi:ferrous iron transport protein B